MADSVGRGISHLTRRTPRAWPCPVRGLEPNPRWRPPCTPGGGPPGCGSPARPRCVGRSRSRLGCTRLGSPALLREVRRPRRVAEAALLVATREVVQLVERAGLARRCRPPGRRPCAGAPGTVSMRRSPGSTSGTSSHSQRARHARVGRRAHRVAGRDGAVARVLVVVDEHAVALLLPPLARRQVGRAPLDLARQRERGAPHLEVAPTRLDPHVDVDALRAATSSGSRAARARRARRARPSRCAGRRPSRRRASGRGRRAARRDGRGRRAAPATG